MSIDPTLATEASDPATDPARLAALANDHPEIRALVAANPSAYPGLLDWLAQFGDADVQAALAARGNGATAASATPEATAAARPVASTPGKGIGALLSRIPKPVLFGGLGGLALVVVGVVVLSNLLAGGRGAGGTTISDAEMRFEPQVAWSIDTLIPEVTPNLDAATTNKGTTVAPHRAIVREYSESELGDREPIVRTVLLDTSTGTVMWELSDELANAKPMALGNSTVFALFDDNQTISVRLGDGSIVGRIDGTPIVGKTHPVSALAGDLLVSTGGEISRVDPVTMSTRWTIPESSDSYVVADVLITGSSVFALADGRLLSWSPAPGDYSKTEDHLFHKSESDDRMALIDPETGAERWAVSTTDASYIMFSTSDVVVVMDVDLFEISAIGLNDGVERWRAPIVDAPGFVLAEEAGVVIVPSGPEMWTAYDIPSGARLYDISLVSDGSLQHSLAETDRTIYLYAGGSSPIDAIDARTGTSLWSLPNPLSNSSWFAFWGGDLVAYHNSRMSSGEEQPRYLGFR